MRLSQLRDLMGPMATLGQAQVMRQRLLEGGFEGMLTQDLDERDWLDLLHQVDGKGDGSGQGRGPDKAPERDIGGREHNTVKNVPQERSPNR
jgi:hypothetical protein